MEFSEVAGELLLVAPGDFVRARTERQRAVRTEDRALATRIGGLRKPAPAAWVVDLLVHEGALDDAIALGPALRAAQASADPDEIARLRRQRAQVVRALTEQGGELAGAAGHEVTRAVLDQVGATIEAAMMDPHAAAAVGSGLLVRPLERVGFDGVDLDGALADPDAVPDAWSGSDAPPIPIGRARGRGRGRKRAGSAGADAGAEAAGDATADTGADAAVGATADTGAGNDAGRDAKAAKRGKTATADARQTTATDARQTTVTEARRAEADARRTSRDADAALDDAEAALDEADDRRTALEDRRAALAAELEQVDHDLAELGEERDRLARARDDAETASDEARAALTAARRRRR